MFSTTVRGGKTFTAEQETRELKKKNIQVKVFGRETFRQQKSQDKSIPYRFNFCCKASQQDKHIKQNANLDEKNREKQ